MKGTKERIISEARSLFAVKGYSGAKTAEIAREAGVSEAALYKHFKNKKEILLACLTPSIQPGGAAPLEEGVQGILKARVDLVRHNLESFNILFKESLSHPEIAKLFMERIFMKDKKMEQLLREYMDRELSAGEYLIYELGITSAIWSILNFEKIQLEVTGEAAELDNIAEEITSFMMYGIAGIRDGKIGQEGKAWVK